MNCPSLCSAEREDLARKVSIVDGVDLIEARRQVNQFMPLTLPARAPGVAAKKNIDGAAVNPHPGTEGCPA
jgi:hypothetical protein